MATQMNGIVPLKDWLPRTSLALRRRSGLLLEVDKAYNDYYLLRSPANETTLHAKLQEYLIEKGRNWEKVERNKASRGLMEYIYNSTAPKRGNNVLEMRVPEARHGALYLWQHAQVRTHWAKIALEGALGVGGSAFSDLQASHYNATDTLHGLSPMGVIPKGSAINYASYGLEGAKVVDGIALKPKGTGHEIKDKGVQLPVEPHPESILVSEIDIDNADDPGLLARARHTLGEFFHGIYEKIKSGVKWIYDYLAIKFCSGQMWGKVGKLITALTNFVLKKVLVHIAPFAASGITIAQGLVQAFAAGTDRILAAYHRSHFIIPAGHPEMIANAIETQMNWAIGKGLYNAAKGGAVLTAEAFSFGGTALINLVAACLEFVYKIITRILEGHAMNAWIKTVQAATLNRNEWKADPKDGKWRPKIVYDDEAFKRLFEAGCNASVCVPMLTVNSGIAGDLMMFTKMFDSTGGILGQSTGESLNGPSASAQKTFDEASAYWSGLKQKGSFYLKSTGFEFASTDRVAAGLMKHAIAGHLGVLSKTNQALSFLGAA